MVQAAKDVTPKVLPSGHLKLTSSATGTHVQYGPTGTAMWIALNQSAGEVEQAAEMLALLWDADRTSTYSNMAGWVSELCAAGLLEHAA